MDGALGFLTVQAAAIASLVLLAAAMAVRRRWIAWPLAGAALGALCAAVALGVARPAPPPSTALPDDRSRTPDGAYASSRACRSCHPGEHESWAQSYHRRMTQPARPDTVLGDFSDRTLTFQDRTYRLWREGDRFLIDMPAFGTDGEGDDRLRGEVVMTTGSHHLQAYWIPMPQGETARERRGREVFAARCQRCHGENAEGGKALGLVGVRLLPAEVSDALADGHDESEPLPAEDAASLAAWVERIQFDGRLLQFPWVWAVDAGVWMHEENSFLQPAPEIEKEERAGDRWGYSCDECHSVAPRYAWRGDESVADSSAAELGIACEACHGPGRAHVERHQKPWTRYLARADDENADIVNPADLDPVRASHVCAQCHADILRSDEGYVTYVPGDDLSRSVFFVRLTDPPYPEVLADAIRDEPTRLNDTFWGDGTVRIAGRDYNGLLETPCHTKGEMSCLSCHAMHGDEPEDQLAPDMEGDAACLGCHADKRDVEAHTHHPPSSPGSRCYNCHMPHTTYGLMKAIRAHRVDSPSVERELGSGRPNACNLCHLDKPLAETAAKLSEWYGQPELTLLPPHDDTAAGVVWILRGDAVVRAVTAWHMGWGPALDASGRGWQAPYLARTLEDDYVAVRFLAWRALTRHEGFADLDFAFDASEPERARFATSLLGAAYSLATPFADREALLLKAGGELDWASVGALESERDNTEVRVAE